VLKLSFAEFSCSVKVGEWCLKLSEMNGDVLVTNVVWISKKLKSIQTVMNEIDTGNRVPTENKIQRTFGDWIRSNIQSKRSQRGEKTLNSIPANIPKGIQRENLRFPFSNRRI
jgi:hypothetical protein